MQMAPIFENKNSSLNGTSILERREYITFHASVEVDFEPDSMLSMLMRERRTFRDSEQIEVALNEGFQL